MVDYRAKSILVTGGTGFIGGRLAERLAFEAQADVRLLVRDWRHAVWASRLPARFLEGDITDPDALAKAMDGCEVVFHCVGVGGDPETCRRINRDGTLRVLEAARAAGVRRLVYLSSVAVHGPKPPENADEKTPLVRTGNAYADSKIDAEEVIAAFTAAHPQSVVILRPTFVWGPRSSYFTIGPVQQIVAGTWRLVDQGLGTCHAVYVDNLVDAMLLAGVASGVDGAAFLITDDQPCSWAEFFLAYARMVGKTALPSVSATGLKDRAARRLEHSLGQLQDFLEQHLPRFEPARFSFRATRFLLRRVRRVLFGGSVQFSDWDLLKYSRRGGLNTSKAKEQLGYIPRISRTEGMRLTESWLRAQRIIPCEPSKPC
ncbi:MAG TPA: NAD-dependent epimerase/dehydratase family protein [Gemmataceae bacterium]|nr:NAD-dependent epimerase/dehydratase family protein [Gemmataceae bacterium]